MEQKLLLKIARKRLPIFMVIIICSLGFMQDIWSQSLVYSKIDSTTAKYVDPSASVNGTGTKVSPWNILPQLQANTVYLFKRSTIYSHSNEIFITVAGVTLGAYGTGAMPVIEQTGISEQNIRSFSNVGEFTIQDLELSSPNSTEYNLYFSGSSGNANILNCNMHGGDTGIRFWNCYNMNIKVIGCEIYNCYSDGIIIFKANSFEAGYNHVYNVNVFRPSGYDDGDCIHMDNIPTIWIHHNNLDHSSRPGKFCVLVAADISTYVGNAIIEYNTMKRSKSDNDNTVFYSNYAKGSQIIFRYNKVQDAIQTIQSRTWNMQIYYNTFSNVDQVMELNSGGASNIKFWNNTINNVGQVIYGAGENVDFKNNIVHTVTDIAFPFTASNVTSNYNDYYNIAIFSNGHTSLGTNDIITDPLFVDSANLDYSLKRGSQCIDHGSIVPLAAPIVDLKGDTVPKGIAIDMGALEYISTDIQAPSTPDGLTHSEITYTGFTLSWIASKDNIGVTGYNVYIDGALFTSVTDTLAKITGLTQGTTYSMTVKATDGDGNVSSEGILSVTTAQSTDNQSPSITNGLKPTDITSDRFTLTWNASTDNIGVTEYDIYKDGVLAKSVSGTTTDISGLTSGTTYSMTIIAKDAVGNSSAESDPLPVTTIAICTGSDDWTPTDFGSNQTEIFTLECDVVPQGTNMAGVLALSDGHATAYANLTCIITFGLDGTVLARNGEVYSSVNPFTYVAESAYHVKFVVNVGTKLYDAYIKNVGGSEETIIASQYAFRAQSMQLNTFIEKADQCHLTVSNLTVNSISTLTPDNNVNSIQICPNPIHDFIDIQVASPSLVTILNIEGKPLIQKSVAGGITRLSLSLGKGIYLIRIKEENNTIYTGKLIVQ